MNNIAKLPDKILVNILKDKNGVFVAELPEFDLHTEADDIWGLISNVNDIIRLYFDIPENNSNCVIYTPPMVKREPEVRQLQSVDFLKYSSLLDGNCLRYNKWGLYSAPKN